MAESDLKKFLIKSKLGLGRDFYVYDDEEATNKVFFIDGKAGLGSHADIKNDKDQIVYVIKAKFINIPRRMEFSKPDGTHFARLSAHISPLKSRMTLELADGKTWQLEGNMMHKHYQVKDGEKIIINIDQKWLSIRDKYFVEIAADTNIPLALGVIWAVDAWRENKNN